MGWVSSCHVITLDWIGQLTSACIFTYIGKAEHKQNAEVTVLQQQGTAKRLTII